MRQERRKFDKSDELNVRAKNKSQVESMSARLIKFYSDPDRRERKKQNVCKTCYYINNTRVGCCAITVSPCSNCGEDITFSSTCTDLFCQSCATTLKQCRRCGQKMD